MLDDKTDHIYNIILSIFLGVLVGLAIHIYNNDDPTTVVLVSHDKTMRQKILAGSDCINLSN